MSEEGGGKGGGEKGAWQQQLEVESFLLPNVFVAQFN